MCDWKPGPRCATDTRDVCAKHRAEYEALNPTGPALDPLTAAQENPENPFRKKYDTMEEKLAAYQDELDKGIEALQNDEDWHRFLDNMSQFHSYSFANQMLIGMQKPDAILVAGFNKWKEMGRHVMKGEKSISILAPKMRTIPRLDANGNPVLDDNGKPIKDRRPVGYTTVSVFDVSQTDGEKLPTDGGARLVSETPPEGLQEDLENAIRKEGFTVSYEKLPPGLNGATSPNGTVVIRDDLPEGARVKTLAHELGHIKAGHLQEMEKYHTGHGGRRGAAECEAESIAYVVLRSNGMSPGVGKDYSFKYIAGWGTDGAVPKESAERVAGAVRSILGEHSFRNVQQVNTRSEYTPKPRSTRKTTTRRKKTPVPA